MIRPMTSDVSALSGNVANSHQAIHFVSSAPSKIPYGGFSPVRLQTSLPVVTFRSTPVPRYRPLPPAWDVHPLSCSVIWACAPSERAERPRKPARPVALGSASGYAVRRPHRLLWPHPSFCGPRRVYLLIPAVLDSQKVPTFICQSLLTCRRPYSDGSSDPPTNQIPGLAFAHLPEARQPFSPTHRTTCGTFYEAATFTYRCGPPACLPRSGRDFYYRACLRRVASSQVGYHYRNVRFIPDRTLTGCSVSLVGCTVNQGCRGCGGRGRMERATGKSPTSAGW